jgi:hypothetical protein
MARRDSRVAITIRSGGGLFIRENRKKEKVLQNLLQQDLPRRLSSNRLNAEPHAQAHAAYLQARILACVASPTAITQADLAPLRADVGLVVPADRQISRPVFFSYGNFRGSYIKRGIEHSTSWRRGGISQ